MQSCATLNACNLCISITQFLPRNKYVFVFNFQKQLFPRLIFHLQNAICVSMSWFSCRKRNVQMNYYRDYVSLQIGIYLLIFDFTRFIDVSYSLAILRNARLIFCCRSSMGCVFHIPKKSIPRLQLWKSEKNVSMFPNLAFFKAESIDICNADRFTFDGFRFV